MVSQIANSENWKYIEEIKKGYSDDKKYLVEESSNKRLLIRLSNIEKYEEKKKEFLIIQKYSRLVFSMSMPIEFGICNDNRNVYMILSYLDGDNLKDKLPYLSKQEQYQLGRKAGKILKTIHTLELDREDIPTKTKKENPFTNGIKVTAPNIPPSIALNIDICFINNGFIIFLSF